MALKHWKVTYKVINPLTLEDEGVKTDTVAAPDESNAGLIKGLDILDAGKRYRLLKIEEVITDATGETNQSTD